MDFKELDEKFLEDPIPSKDLFYRKTKKYFFGLIKVRESDKAFRKRIERTMKGKK